MRVLIAGRSPAVTGGVQTYERDLALWLLERGHSPVLYAAVPGDATRDLIRETIPFTDDLNDIAARVDIIHGDSPLETMAALLHFPGTPAIFVRHGWGPAEQTTPRFPRIFRYVAVDDTCADRLTLREGIDPERVTVLLNAVDLASFRQRPPLPSRPRRAIVFGNAAHELTYLPAIREACRRASIEVDVVGELAGTAVSSPDAILGRYDLAFAKAKCALEAMACGLAVILCDTTGVGGMVRSAEVDRLRRLNFGIRSLQRPLSADALAAELALYDAADARLVSDRIRETAGSDAMHASLFAIYESVLEEQARTPADPLAESRAAAAFLQRMGAQEWKQAGRVLTLFQASQRALSVPLVGPVASRVLRRLLRRR